MKRSYDESESFSDGVLARESAANSHDIGPMAASLNHPFRLIVGGRSTLGKTTLAVDLIVLRLMPVVRQCFACCPTFKQQPALQPLRDIPGAFPDSHIFTSVTDATFERIFKYLNKQRCKVPTLLFVDDAAGERATNLGNKGAFARLCLAAPHLNLSIVGVFQRLTACSNALRDNCEGLVMFFTTKKDDLDIVRNEFNGFLFEAPSERIIDRILKLCWKSGRYCFILRPPRIAAIYYYSEFNKQVHVKT